MFKVMANWPMVADVGISDKDVIRAAGGKYPDGSGAWVADDPMRDMEWFCDSSTEAEAMAAAIRKVNLMIEVEIYNCDD